MYHPLDIQKNTELYLERSGLANPEFTLSDGAFEYGKIKYHGLSRHNASVDTANYALKIHSDNPISRTTTVTDEHGKLLGTGTQEWLSRSVTFTFETGFRAVLTRPSIWSRQYTWNSEGYGELMHFYNPLFSWRKTVSLIANRAPSSVIPVLVFLGSHLIILSSHRKAVS